MSRELRPCDYASCWRAMRINHFLTPTGHSSQLPQAHCLRGVLFDKWPKITTGFFWELTYGTLQIESGTPGSLISWEKLVLIHMYIYLYSNRYTLMHACILLDARSVQARAQLMSPRCGYSARKHIPVLKISGILKKLQVPGGILTKNDPENGSMGSAPTCGGILLNT